MHTHALSLQAAASLWCLAWVKERQGTKVCPVSCFAMPAGLRACKQSRHARLLDIRAVFAVWQGQRSSRRATSMPEGYRGVWRHSWVACSWLQPLGRCLWALRWQLHTGGQMAFFGTQACLLNHGQPAIQCHVWPTAVNAISAPCSTDKCN